MNERWFCLICVTVLLALIDTTQADLVGWWKFDEGSGITADDSSGFGHNGTLHNMDNNDWVDGVLGKALELDGVDDYISIPPFELVGTDTLTISAWIKRSGEQPEPLTGIVFSRDGHTAAGICFGMTTPDWAINHELAYTWNNNQAAWSWQSRLIVPNNQWVFVALVVEPAKATLHLGENGILSSATNPKVHDIEEFDGVTCIGRDVWPGKNRNFRGLIDEVRIYKCALDEDEINAIYRQVVRFDSISDTEITMHPDEALKKAQEYLRLLYERRTKPPFKTEHADEIAATLLVIAKAKEAKKLHSSEVLTDYYELIEQYPYSPEALEALRKVAVLGGKSDLEYATQLLNKDNSITTKAIHFYKTVIGNSITKSDYVNTEKYLRLFIDNYVSTKDDLKLVSRLINEIGQIENREKLYIILQRHSWHDPKSEISIAVFRYCALELYKGHSFDELWNLADQTRLKFPGTKLAIAAAAVLADKQYEEGNYVSALQEFDPSFIALWYSVPDTTSHIDDLMRVYQANTLRPEGIDLTRIYEAVAKYALATDRNLIAVYCYEQGARVGGFGLDEFKKFTLGTVKDQRVDLSDEILFWRAAFEAERGDPASAATKYEFFLENNAKSVLAAKAYYCLARFKIASGQYLEASEAMSKAKAISPCPTVIQLEQDLKKQFVLEEQSRN